ncbi:U3 small nucleolar RNA-associated protein 14 homolog A [Neodiprion virginianus]|uniref:U3 small nucleolar RNA-associated protein 14 homolog A n=1 Tax=Neodiprion virginianus TaxID=2961670 RepID=UPI001EE72C86|nr:U3 small nucleolar RNA-associated protein 14 homolog A [Neodiprion virginianus]
MSDYEFEGGSDHEVSESHSKLLEAVTQLDKGQRVRKAERSEPSLEVSEFHLVQSGIGRGNAVHLRDLAKALGSRATHADISRKLRATQRKSRTLSKPLEKPAAARIKRSVGFENVKKELGKWDSIVSRNRTAEHLYFPLKQGGMRLETSNEFLKRFKIQSELEMELAALEPVKKKHDEERENEAPMSLEQIIERRQETARFRAQQSYREAKAHRQNKIKSKKFHRIERKQKTKQQLKEFEELQKTDPEAALAKLELLEKSRAQERMTLRHKSTGQWAKNKQIRAKYDKESRQDLAQQLSISRELTQKLRNNEAEEDDEDEEDTGVKPLTESEKENPWTNNIKNQSEIDQFISGYRKYWDAKNEEQKSKESKEVNGTNGLPETGSEVANTFEVPQIKDQPATLNPVEEIIVENPELMFDDGSEDESGNDSQDKEELVEKPLELMKKKRKDAETLATKSANKKRNKSPNKRKFNQRVEAAGTSLWIVTPSPGIEIDEIFDTVTANTIEKCSEKLNNMREALSRGVKQGVDERKKRSTKEYEPDLGFKNQKQRPIIDEQMVESAGRGDSAKNDEREELRKLAITRSTGVEAKPKEAEIDPNKFINVRPKYLKTQMPDVVTGGDEGLDDSEVDEAMDDERHNLISEAFADDDVVDEFRQEKSDEVKKSLPESLDLTLPGWGSWGGKNLQSVSSRKKRRFILKFPKDAPRRDENKGDVIIIEEKDPKIKEHQVNELPFPFTSVKDFEASIRAPIGRTFVPENAFKRLIEPNVKTRLGKIIEPMDEEALVSTKKMTKNKKTAPPQKRGKYSRNKRVNSKSRKPSG